MTTGGDRLESVTQAAMLDGADASLVLKANGGPDVFQLRDVTLNLDGSFTLTDLLRGRRGTDVFVDGHAAGEVFVLLDTDDVETFAVPLGELGLAASQANRHGLIMPTGSLTAARLVTQPASRRRLALRNATAGGQAVTVGYAGGGGATVAVATDSTALLVGDGTDLHGVAGGGGSATLAGLDDVDVVGAVNGDLLRFDGALWGPVGSGVLQRAMLPFKGAPPSAHQRPHRRQPAPPRLLAGRHPRHRRLLGCRHPFRLTIPAGITEVRLMGAVALQASSIAGGVFLSLEKNGAADVIGAAAATFRQGSTGYTNNDFATFTTVLPVVAGDWFKLRVSFTSPSSNAVLANSRSGVALEVVETEDAADPPADITGFKPGQPGPAELLLRLPVARRTRLAVDLAGSRGGAGTAATAEADVDIRRNATCFAAMRFPAGADTAAFIAVAETVLEPDGVLSVVAPRTADATPRDNGLALNGSLVL